MGSVPAGRSRARAPQAPEPGPRPVRDAGWIPRLQRGECRPPVDRRRPRCRHRDRVGRDRSPAGARCDPGTDGMAGRSVGAPAGLPAGAGRVRGLRGPGGGFSQPGDAGGSPHRAGSLQRRHARRRDAAHLRDDPAGDPGPGDRLQRRTLHDRPGAGALCWAAGWSPSPVGGGCSSASLRSAGCCSWPPCASFRSSRRASDVPWTCSAPGCSRCRWWGS